MFFYLGFHPMPRPSKVSKEGGADREDTCEDRSGGGQDSNAVSMLHVNTSNEQDLNFNSLNQQGECYEDDSCPSIHDLWGMEGGSEPCDDSRLYL